MKIHTEKEIEFLAEEYSDDFTTSLAYRDGMKVMQRMMLDCLIDSAKYGYEYHQSKTSFPDKSFEDNCVNNFKQWLINQGEEYNDKLFR